MKLDPNLVCNTEKELNFESSLYQSEAKGTYNTMQFAIKLRDDIRHAIDAKDNSNEKIQAYSTFLHENIHWWQHVGSNFGFIYSLSYPAMAALAKPDLIKLMNKKIPFKPLIKFEKEYFKKHKKSEIEELSRILSIYYNIEYAKCFSFDNKNISKIIEKKDYLISIGHSYSVLWQASIQSLTTIDKNYKFLPKTNDWSKKFKKLEEMKVEGFGTNSLTVSSLGIKAIYEGQAIFNQLQYLASSLNGNLSFKDCENAGMLYGIYYQAFNLFIKVTTFNKPDNFLNSEVALFLLVCDIAINPTNGFPFDIYDDEKFITINDPGIRFEIMCYFIRENKDQYLNSIIKYSKEEYINISKKLSIALFSISPYESCQLIKKGRLNRK